MRPSPPYTLFTPSSPALTLAAAITVALATGYAAQAHAENIQSAQSAKNAQNATPPLRIDIAAQPLGQALNELARQADLQMSFPATLVAGKQAPHVSGQLSVSQALERLLAGSGLSAVLDGTAVVVRPLPPPGAAAAPSALPTVTVSADAVRENAWGPVHGYVAKRSATGTKTDTPILEVPQSISVIGRAEMDARGSQDVMDAVRYTPGVTTSTYGPDNRGWEDILLRGFNTADSTYNDGLAQPPSGITHYLNEPYALERVEVLRGPSSMMFGKGDAGGIINRVSKEPTGERLREVEVQYGSYSRKQLAFDLGDRIAGNSDLSYRLVGVTLDSNDQDSYPDGQRLTRTRSFIAPSVRWAPDAKTSLTVFGEFMKNSTAEDPYYYSVNHVLSAVKMGDYSFSHLKQSQAAIGYRLATALNDEWTLRQNFRYSHIDLSRRAIWVDELHEDERTISRLARTWNDPLSMTVLDTNLQGKLRDGSTEHTVLLGIDFGDLKGRERRFIGPAPDLDLFEPVYGQAVAIPTDPLSKLTQTTRQIGLYAQDQIKFGDSWVLTVGGRQDKVHQITDDELSSTHTRQYDSAFSGRVGITHLVGNGWAPYLSYSESFLPNSGVDAQSKPFKPSQGKQVEAGVKLQPQGSRSLFTAAVFNLQKTNVVTYDPIDGDGRQIGKQRSRGIELEGKTELVSGLSATASYTWINMKVLQSSDPAEIGKVPPLLPKQAASLWLDYLWRNGVGFGGGMRYIGKRQNDEHNTTFERGVALFDAAVHYERGSWRFALNVSNLADKKYNAICYHGECYQGARRAATLTVRYTF